MLKYDFQLARSEYLQGKNVVDFLKQVLKVDHNTPEIIEAAYDLQAGTYVERAKSNLLMMEKIAQQSAEVIKEYAKNLYSILDVGTGELTSFSFLMTQLSRMKLDFYACDISLSRLMVGRNFASSFLSKELYNRLKVFCADMFRLPILNKSIDIVTSYHALEPNGGREALLLKEILRICRKKAILFEPSYELNSNDGKKRMDRLGYIKDLPNSIEKAGGKLEEVILMKYNSNDLNPTTAYIITPPEYSGDREFASSVYADPGENSMLRKEDGCFFSPHYGVAYPIICGIPVLREKYAILSSVMEGIVK